MEKTSILVSRVTGLICPDRRLPHGKAKTFEAVEAKLRIAEVVKKELESRAAEDTDASTAVKTPSRNDQLPPRKKRRR